MVAQNRKNKRLATNENSAGFLSREDKSKIDGVQDGAEANPTPSELINIINTELGSATWQLGGTGGGAEFLTSIASGTIVGRTTALEGVSEELTPTQVRTLINVEDGATQNSTDTFLLNRDNHTGTIPVSDIPDFTTEVDNLILAKSVTQLTDVSDAGSGEIITSVERTKLQGIETGATADQTGPEIRSLLNSTLSNTVWADPTNISIALNANFVEVRSSTGSLGTISASTGVSAGVMTSSDRIKLDSIESGAQINPTPSTIVTQIDTELGSSDWQNDSPTNLSVLITGTTLEIQSDTGADVTLNSATSVDAGILTATDKSKLDGIESGAQANPTGGDIVNSINAELGGTGWQVDTDTDTQLSDAQVVAAVNSELGGTSWQSGSNTELQDVITGRLIGRASLGNGPSEELTAAQVHTLLNIEDGSTADQTGPEIKSLYEAETNTNAFTDAEKSKLSAIENNATADQTGTEIVSSINTELGSTAWQSGGGTGTTPLTGPEFTYTSGQLTQIDYDNGYQKILTYSGSQLTQLDFIQGGTTTRKTFIYNPDDTLAEITEVTL